MGLPWVKVHVSVLDNDVFKQFSGPARLTFLIALPLAQKLDMNGALATRLKPLSVADIAVYTGLAMKHQPNALAELVKGGFLTLSDSTYRVERFAEFQGPAPSTDRVKKHREVKQSETFQEHFDEAVRNAAGNVVCNERNLLDTDIDIDTLTPFVSRGWEIGETCSCRELVLSTAHPPEVVVVAMLAVFANCRTESAQKRDRARWLSALRDMRSQGFSWSAIWAAFSQSHADEKHAPFHALSAVWNNLRAASPGTGKSRGNGLMTPPKPAPIIHGWVDGVPWEGPFGAEPIGFSSVPPLRLAERR